MLGSVYLQLKQFPPAIESYQHALKLNPLDASAEFGLSRALQQSGDMAQAKQHLTRFQYITQNKLGATMSLTYGEQGQYSRAQELAVSGPGPPAIKVTFVDVTQQGRARDEREAEQPSNLGSAVFWILTMTASPIFFWRLRQRGWPDALPQLGEREVRRCDSQSGA